MTHGGRRNGAGRKKGAAAKKTRAVAVRAAAEGITPIEVMLDAMRRHYEARRYDEAASIAKDAAPYIHPKLASVVTKDDSPPRTVIVEIRRASNANAGEPAATG